MVPRDLCRPMAAAAVKSYSGAMESKESDSSGRSRRRLPRQARGLPCGQARGPAHLDQKSKLATTAIDVQLSGAVVVMVGSVVRQRAPRIGSLTKASLARPRSLRLSGMGGGLKVEGEYSTRLIQTGH